MQGERRDHSAFWLVWTVAMVAIVMIALYLTVAQDRPATGTSDGPDLWTTVSEFFTEQTGVVVVGRT